MPNRGAKDYPIPAFLVTQGVAQEVYGKWLDEKAKSVKYRDKKRFERLGLTGTIVLGVIRLAIHRAVCDSGDKDFYTGEPLDWNLLQRLNGNGAQAKKEDHHRVPTVDHHTISVTNPVFRICSFRTNKCKSDYSLEELKDFCKKFLTHQDGLQ